MHIKNGDSFVVDVMRDEQFFHLKKKSKEYPFIFGLARDTAHTICRYVSIVLNTYCKWDIIVAAVIIRFSFNNLGRLQEIRREERRDGI